MNMVSTKYGYIIKEDIRKHLGELNEMFSSPKYFTL